jgi:hypothetical protein
MPGPTRRIVLTAMAATTVGAATAATITARASAAAAGSWTSVQPGVPSSGCDGVRATVALDANGALTLEATWDCQQVLAPAPIGLVTAEADYTTGLEFVSRGDETISFTYEVVAGKSRVRERTATETRLVFAKDSAEITVFVRTSADGVALRYELPSGATVLGEATSFELPADAQLSCMPFANEHEYLYATSAVSAVPGGEYSMSMFAQLADGASVLLAESGVDGGYSGGRFAHDEGTGRFTVTLADAEIQHTEPFATAWRVAVIGTTATVVESTLVDDVAVPSQVTDTSWIRPGVSAWPWFDGMHETQRDLEKLKQWADYAASQGWPYLLVDDGWIEAPEIIPELVAYAGERGVLIMLWYHWRDLDTADKRADQFTTITEWGVVGVKMDFMGSEEQAIHQWYDAALADARDYQLMVDLHGSRLPVGVHRTWPHVLTSEAIRGEESGPNRNIEHVAAIPFTRGAIGPTDYSPMSFQMSNPNSDGAELALGVVLDSGILLPGSTIPDYEARPEAQRWLRTLPAVWDETRYVSGDPLTGAVIARRDGDRWFVGSLRRGDAGTTSYPTDFLGSTGTWHAEITTDGPDGLVRTSQVISAGDPLSVEEVADGGHAVKLTRAPSVPEGYHQLTVAGSDHVVGVEGGSDANDAKIVRSPGSDSPHQRFEFTPVAGGYTRLVNEGSGRDVVIDSASRDAGAKVIQYEYATGSDTNDEWLLEDAGEGRIRLANRFSGLYLTAGDAEGTQCEQRPYDGGDHQTFTIS